MINFDELGVRAMIGAGLGLIGLFLALNFFAKFPTKTKKSPKR